MYIYGKTDYSINTAKGKPIGKSQRATGIKMKPLLSSIEHITFKVKNVHLRDEDEDDSDLR